MIGWLRFSSYYIVKLTSLKFHRNYFFANRTRSMITPSHDKVTNCNIIIVKHTCMSQLAGFMRVLLGIQIRHRYSLEIIEIY